VAVGLGAGDEVGVGAAVGVGVGDGVGLGVAVGPMVGVAVTAGADAGVPIGAGDDVGGPTLVLGDGSALFDGLTTGVPPQLTEESMTRLTVTTMTALRQDV
jgi:hypothetical protein